MPVMQGRFLKLHHSMKGQTCLRTHSSCPNCVEMSGTIDIPNISGHCITKLEICIKAVYFTHHKIKHNVKKMLGTVTTFSDSNVHLKYSMRSPSIEMAHFVSLMSC